jgi:hypothetical protein
MMPQCTLFSIASVRSRASIFPYADDNSREFAQHDVIVDDQDARPAVYIRPICRGLPSGSWATAARASTA